jgi:hypothetical protein
MARFLVLLPNYTPTLHPGQRSVSSQRLAVSEFVAWSGRRVVKGSSRGDEGWGGQLPQSFIDRLPFRGDRSCVGCQHRGFHNIPSLPMWTFSIPIQLYPARASVAKRCPLPFPPSSSPCKAQLMAVGNHTYPCEDWGRFKTTPPLAKSACAD